MGDLRPHISVGELLFRVFYIVIAKGDKLDRIFFISIY